MKSIKYLGFVLLLLLVAVALIVGCAPKAAPTTGPIKVGLILPYTGFAAAYGPFNQEALELKLDEIGWEIAGRKVVLIVEDEACDPAVAVTKAKKLVERDKVDVIVGPQLSSSALGVAKYTAASRTPCLIPDWQPYSILTQGGENVFMAGGTGGSHRLAEYAYSELGYRTVTVMHEDFEAGYDFTQGFIDAFEALGGKMIQRQATPINEMDFAPYITNMKDADAMVLWYAAPIALLQQYKAAGKTMPILCTNGTPMGELFLGIMGDNALGIIGATTYTAEINTSRNRLHVQNYQQKYGRHPESPEGMATYANFTMYVEAVKKTNGDTTPEKVIKAMHELKDVETPRGLESYNEDGSPIIPDYIGKVVKKGDRYCVEVLKKYPWWSPEAD
ncbi:ABC transporter substrate-binding protein [Chloroflexota bacterium]